MIEIRLANANGLDISNAQHSVAIDEALFGIEDTNAFLEFCVDKKDAITYSTKPERLMTLSTMYKKLQSLAKIPIGTASDFSTVLVAKVENARVFLKNELEVGNDKPFSRLIVDGHKYFKEYEIKALSALGSPRYLIELSEEHRLKEELVKLFIKEYTQKKSYEALTTNQKKMQKLLSN